MLPETSQILIGPPFQMITHTQISVWQGGTSTDKIKKPMPTEKIENQREQRVHSSIQNGTQYHCIRSGCSSSSRPLRAVGNWYHGTTRLRNKVMFLFVNSFVWNTTLTNEITHVLSAYQLSLGVQSYDSTMPPSSCVIGKTGVSNSMLGPCSGVMAPVILPFIPPVPNQRSDKIQLIGARYTPLILSRSYLAQWWY